MGKIINTSIIDICKNLPLKIIKEIITIYQKETNTRPKSFLNMNVQDLLEVEKSGLVTIGAHTLNHPILKNECDENCDYEITGSIKELQSSWHKIDKKMMRVCFDLDNTLVTYPTVPGDYRTVRPIHRMIELVRKMKADGHTIIIHTARRMETHKYNVGSVIRDIGPVTFQTLSDFDIPCDEILFGKPLADIYIDDRAVNPYRESVESMGYLHPDVVQL